MCGPVAVRQSLPANTKTSVGAMLCQRRRRWHSIVPTLDGCAGVSRDVWQVMHQYGAWGLSMQRRTFCRRLSSSSPICSLWTCCSRLWDVALIITKLCQCYLNVGPSKVSPECVCTFHIAYTLKAGSKRYFSWKTKNLYAFLYTPC